MKLMIIAKILNTHEKLVVFEVMSVFMIMSNVTTALHLYETRVIKHYVAVV